MDKKINNFDFDFMPIGQAIKKAREAKKVTREQLAEIVDYKLCTFFHHFSFLPPLFVFTLSTLYIFEFPNEFFVFFRARVRQPLR